MIHRMCLGLALVAGLGILAAPARAQNDDLEALKKKIADLEKKNKQLEAENARLKAGVTTKGFNPFDKGFKPGPAPEMVAGEITKIDGDKITINIGKSKGAKVGGMMMLDKAVKGLGGMFKITQVKDDEAVTKLVDFGKGLPEVAVGDKVGMPKIAFTIPDFKGPDPGTGTGEFKIGQPVKGKVTKADEDTYVLSHKAGLKAPKGSMISVQAGNKGVMLKVTAVGFNQVTGEVMKFGKGPASKLEEGDEVIIRVMSGNVPGGFGPGGQGGGFRPPQIPNKED
jgi:hypothetical protein